MAELDIYSPYRFCFEQLDADGRRFMSEREPFGYVELADNQRHPVVQGDSWHMLAYTYFRPITITNELGIDVEVSSLLGWVIRDFQKVPVMDPFICPKAGEILVIPSRRTVLTKVFDPDRRKFS